MNNLDTTVAGIADHTTVRGGVTHMLNNIVGNLRTNASNPAAILQYADMIQNGALWVAAKVMANTDGAMADLTEAQVPPRT